MFAPPPERRISRRKFLALTGLGAGVVTGGIATTYGAVSSPITTSILETTDHTIYRSDLPEAFDGFSIAFITDLHYSPVIAREWIRRIVRIINLRKVDLVLLGGDYIWVPESAVSSMTLPFNTHNHPLATLHGPELAAKEYHDLAEDLSQLKSTLGTFGVVGNHDRWIDLSLCKECFLNANASLLINDHIQLRHPKGGAIEIFGADDYWTGTPKRPKFSASKESLKIFLSHNPDHVVEQCENALPPSTLCLSGHTHGGQICLPLVGALLDNIRSPGYGYGLNRIGESLIFTSRGIGVVELPIRINCPQEVVFITFRRDSPASSAGA